MTRISPFAAVRPVRDKAHLVASRSYVTYSPRHLSRKLSENPYSFIHIINPEHGMRARTRPNSKARFEKIRARYRHFCEAGIFLQEEQPAYYIYRQSDANFACTGLICGVHVADYLEGKIKVHEHTLTSRVDVFSRYLDVCGFNAEPVLLTYKERLPAVEALLAEHTAQREEYDFSTTDGKRHQLWPVYAQAHIALLTASMAELSCLYIADGHHRMASSANLSRWRQERNGVAAERMSNYALAYIIPVEELRILPFHRVLSMYEPLNEDALFRHLKAHFEVSKAEGRVLPEQRRDFGMRLASGWYRLRYRGRITEGSVVEGLDAMILTRSTLEPYFGIADQKTDRRIDFVPGNRPLKELERAVDMGKHSVLFTLHGVSSGEILAVSDAAEVMPPKSTFVEPKLRSGLTIMQL